MAIPSTDYSALLSGSMLIREYGAAAPSLSVGNVSALTLSPQEDVKSLQDFTQPGGNKRAEVRRLTGVDFSFTFTDYSAENFARGLRADIDTIAAGTASAEQVVAYKGGYVGLSKIAATITSVEPVGGGTPFVSPGDYELRDGQLYIPSGSTIAAVTGGAANIEVDYTFAAQKNVEALVKSNQQYEVMFVGLNEARSGKAVRVCLHKVSGGVLQEMALIGDDFLSGQVNGSLLPDSSKAGGGTDSAYFTVEIVD